MPRPQAPEADLELVATWAGCMIGTALDAGITPRQIKEALKPSNVAQFIKIMREHDARKDDRAQRPR